MTHDDGTPPDRPTASVLLGPLATHPVAALVTDRDGVVVAANDAAAACPALGRCLARGSVTWLTDEGVLRTTEARGLTAALAGRGSTTVDVDVDEQAVRLTASTAGDHVLFTSVTLDRPVGNRYDAVLRAHNADAQVVFDRDLRVVHANETFLASFETPRTLDQVVGRRFGELDVETAAVQATEETVLGVLSTGTQRRRDVTSRLGVYDVVYTPVSDPDGDTVLVVGTARDMTARRRAERQLGRRSAQLTNAEELVGFGTWSWDLDTDLLELSDQAYRLLGFPPTSIDPLMALRTVVPDLEVLRTQVRYAVVEGHRATHTLTTRRGTPVTLVCAGAPPRSRASRAWGVLLADLPARPTDLAPDVVDEALEMADAVVLVTDRALRLVGASSGGHRFVDRVRTRGIDTSLDAILDAASVQEGGRWVPLTRSAVFPAMLSGEPVTDTPLRVRLPSGTIHLSGSARGLRDASGVVDRLVVVLRDREPVRRRELELAGARSRVRALVAAIEASTAHRLYTWSVDGEGAVRHIDDAAADVLGTEAGTIRTTPGVFFDGVHPEDLDGLRAILERAVTEGGVDTTYRWQHPDGRTRLHRMLCAVEHEDDGDVALFGTVIDISEPAGTADVRSVLLDTVDGLVARDVASIPADALPVHLLPGWDLLSEREVEVVRMTLDGMRSQAIGRRLHMSASAVRNRLSDAYRKLGVSGQVELSGRLARLSAYDAGALRPRST